MFIFPLNVNHTVDVSERVAAILEQLLHQQDHVRKVAEIRQQVQEMKERFMNNLDGLRAAVADDSVANAEVMDQFSAALAELAADVAGLDVSGPVAEETAKIVANTQALRDLAATVSQQIRDAVPTPAPEPEPEPEPEPIP